MDPLTFAEVREILDLIDQGRATEVRVEVGATRIEVIRGRSGAAEAQVPLSVQAPVPVPALAAPERLAPPPPSPAPVPAVAQTAADGAPAGCVAVRAPLAGMFYAAPAPGAPPFVQAGDVVTPVSDLCIIEVMKVMNSVKAGIAGEVVRIDASNESLVEYNAPLVWIRPQAEA